MITIGDLCIYYLVEEASKKKSFADEKCIVNRYIMSKFANRNIDDIRYKDVYELHSSLSSTPYMANRVLSTFSLLFHIAQKLELVSQGTNPCSLVTRYKEDKRHRYLSEDETRNLMSALQNLPDDKKYFQLLILLLYFTGARYSEIRTARWDNINGQLMLLLDSKTGRRTIHLNSHAMALLKVLSNYRRGDLTIPGGQYLMPDNGDLNFLFPEKMAVRYPWWKLCREAKLRDFRIHDLRHNFASAGIAANLTLAKIGELLGHSSPATTARYAHLRTKEALSAAEDIGDKLV